MRSREELVSRREENLRRREEERNREEKRRVTEAANYALLELKKAKKDLDGAFWLGALDIVGGMYVVSGIKHVKIESAKKHIHDAMIWLQQFRRPTDYEDYANKNYMRLGMLGMILDIGVDGIPSDIYAQTRIAGLRARVEEAIKRLETIMRSAGILESYT